MREKMEQKIATNYRLAKQIAKQQSDYSSLKNRTFMKNSTENRHPRWIRILMVSAMLKAHPTRHKQSTNQTAERD
jgi:hypothetical protein